MRRYIVKGKCRAVIVLLVASQAWNFCKEVRFLSSRGKTDVPEKPDVDPTPFRSSFHSNDEASLPFCTRKQVRDGRWVPIHYDKPPYVSKNIKLQCHNETYYEKHGYDTYDWRPNDGSCELRRWNATAFCYLVQRATVSIIGDSLSWEMYSSLMQLLGTRVHQLDQHRSKSDNINIVLKGCWPKTKFVYRNDPRLQFVRQSISKDFPLVLVLNRGPHYVNDSHFVRGMNETLHALHEWRASCANFGFLCHLFWRTSVPGHPNCNRTDEGRHYFQQPDNDLSRVEALIANPLSYDNVTLEYHWHDFQHQNNLAIQMLEESGVNATILDAYDLNVRRVDAHRAPNDCLHNCYPGKMDVLNQLFLHFLSVERTDDDVEGLQSLFWEVYEKVKGPEATAARLAKYNLTAQRLAHRRPVSTLLSV
jgi:GDSL/SGNH-like Acyl-Esterase family found in Pmr5 and Cas1p